MLTIAVDAMGGDHAPKSEVEGAIRAAAELNLRILLVGQVLALFAAGVSWLLFRMTADSAASARTIDSYARLDLSGLNPLWISIAAAIGEEMLFRAALQPLLGVWIVSLLFLVTHVPVYRFRKLEIGRAHV